nr:S1 RNA-binding domain-containing protein [Anaerolineae bacterium]
MDSDEQTLEQKSVESADAGEPLTDQANQQPLEETEETVSVSAETPSGENEFESAPPDSSPEIEAVTPTEPEQESDKSPTPEEEEGWEDEDTDDSPTDEELFLAALSDEEVIDTRLRRGQIVEGTIAGITSTEILIDVGGKSEGVITGREFEAMDEETLASFEVGQTITVMVMKHVDGAAHLSLRRALEAQDWVEAERLLESKEAYETEVTNFNKGGLIVKFGRVRGFVPASQVGNERRRRSSGTTPDERWGPMIGETMLVKVIEVDRARNRLILSERATERERRAARRKELLKTLEVGQVIKGRVVRLTEFGAFVDLGGVDGLVHLSQLAWEHVDHPGEVLKVGDKINVEVINIDQERGRIGLSRKKCLDDPWDTITTNYVVGQLVQGEITKIATFGAFARLVDNPAIEGLVHISELSDRRIRHPGEVVKEEDLLTLRIIRIEPEKKRLGLSLKQVDSSEYLDDDWQTLLDASQKPEEEPIEVSAEELVEEKAEDTEPVEEPDAMVDHPPSDQMVEESGEAAVVEDPSQAEAEPEEAEDSAVVEEVGENLPDDAEPEEDAAAPDLEDNS